MQKGEKTLFSKIVVIAILMLIINLADFSYRYKTTNLAGYSIKEDFYTLYESMPDNYKMFLLLQWLAIIALLIYVSIKDKVEYDSKKKNTVDPEKELEQSKTDLDSLYRLLKEKKSLDIEIIAKSFNISNDLALEWSKLLESGDLVKIDYSNMGETIVKFVEKN